MSAPFIAVHEDSSDLEPTASAQWVADALRDRIVKGEYAPGSRLVERKISAELNISRTPVREALKLLHADGLISISRNKGAQVLPYRAGEALQLFDVIASLESLAAERLAQSIAPDDLDTLEEMHEAMLLFYRIGNQGDYFDANSAIHDFIIDRSGNPVLTATYGRLIARARRGRFLAIMKPERLEEAVREHETLMIALRTRDPDLAARTWRQHLLHSGETVASVLESPEAPISGKAGAAP